MKKVKLACGCEHDADKWIHECPSDQEEHNRIHAQAQRDHIDSLRQFEAQQNKDLGVKSHDD